MSSLNQLIHFRFFKNKELNHFYLAIFLMSFGEFLINIFVPIYLYRLGFTIPKVIFFYFLLSVYFVLFSYLGAVVVSRVGVKHSMLLSSPFLILYYVGLIFIQSSEFIFFILPLLLSFRMILFNYGFHLNYINHSEKKKRGRELAIFGSIIILTNVIAPLVGSQIAKISFSLVFISSSLFIVLGTIPILFSRDKFERLNFGVGRLFKKMFSIKNRGNLISFIGYATESIIGRIIWPVFLIIVLVSIVKTGFIISITMFISLIVFFFIGKLADSMSRIKLLRFATVLYFIGWTLRIFANTSIKIFLIDSYKNLSERVLHLPWSAHNYDLAKRQNYFEYIVFREIVFNLTRIIILPVLIIIFYLNFHPFLISFIIASISSAGYLFINK